MMNMNDEHMITDVEDENEDENAIDGGNGNGDDEADDNVNDGDDMAGTDSGVLHGEIVPHEEAERALAIHGVSAEVEALYADYTTEEALALKVAIEDAKHIIHGTAVETGRALARVKSLVKHGKFEDYIQVEFAPYGISKRSAQNLMSLANVADTTRSLFGPESESKILALPRTLNYALGDNYVPNKARGEIIENIIHDEYETADEILEAIREAKEAKKAERQSRKGGADSEEGEAGEDAGEGEKPLTKQQKTALHNEGQRKYSMWQVAASIASGKPDVQAIHDAMATEMGTGPYHRMKPEEHQAFSEMLFKVLAAHLKNPESVEKIRPVVPPLPEPKIKKAKEPKAAKAPKEAKA